MNHLACTITFNGLSALSKFWATEVLWPHLTSFWRPRCWLAEFNFVSIVESMNQFIQLKWPIFYYWLIQFCISYGYPSHRDCFPISIRTFNSWTSCLMAAQVKSWLIHNFCIFGRTIHYIETGLSCTNQIFHLIRKFSQCVLRAHNNTRDKYWVYIWLCQRLHGRRMKNIKKSE